MFSPASSTSSKTADVATPGERTELPDMLVAWPQDPRGAWSYCVSIPSYQASENDVVFYAVEVAVQSPFGTASEKRQVLRRYTAFRTLYTDLKALPEDQLPKTSKANIPAPPPKTIGKKKDEAALMERRSALSEWLQRALSDLHVSRTPPVLAFLELPRAARRAVAAVLRWDVNGDESDLDEAALSANIPEQILKRADGSTKFHDKTVALLAYAADVEAQLEEQERRNRSERNDGGISEVTSPASWEKPVLIESIEPFQQPADLLSGPAVDLLDGPDIVTPIPTMVEHCAPTAAPTDLLSADGPTEPSFSGLPENDADRAAAAAALAAGLRVSRRAELRRMCEDLERKLSSAVGDIALMAEALETAQQKRLDLEEKLRDSVPRTQIQSLEAANVALSEELRRREQYGGPDSHAVQAEKQQLVDQVMALSAEVETLRREKDSELAKKKVLAKELKSLMKASKANEEKEKLLMAQREMTTAAIREATDLRYRIETAASVNMAMEAEGEAGLSSTACLSLLGNSDERLRALQAEIDLTFNNDGDELRNAFAQILRDTARLNKTVNSLLRGTMHVDSTAQSGQVHDATQKLWHALR